MDVIDHYNVVYIIFFYLSIGMLLPWNFFINVNGYWMYKFRSVNETVNLHSPSFQPNDLQLQFTADLAVAAMAPNVTLLILNALFGHRFRIFPRLLVSLICIVILFSITLALVYVDTDSWQKSFLYLTLLIVVLINVCNGIFQGGLFGLAGMFPSKYMNSILTGQGLGGVFAALINIFMLVVINDEVSAAFYCFLLSVVFLAGSTAAFLHMSRTNVYKHFTSAANAKFNTEETKQPLLQDNAPAAATTTTAAAPRVSIQHIVSCIWEEAVTVFLIFFVTLACFPAVTVLIQSVDRNSADAGAWANLYFVPVSCFLFYNVGDYIGRMLASLQCLPKPGSKLGLLFSIVRFVFIPLFMFCNAVPQSRVYTPVLIHQDWIYFVIMFLFAISNGFLTTVVMVHAPSRVAPHEQETAANLMAGILGIGLAAGAVFSAVLVRAL